MYAYGERNALGVDVGDVLSVEHVIKSRDFPIRVGDLVATLLVQTHVDEGDCSRWGIGRSSARRSLSHNR